jgi:hypothetical protein
MKSKRLWITIVILIAFLVIFFGWEFHPEIDIPFVGNFTPPTTNDSPESSTTEDYPAILVGSGSHLDVTSSTFVGFKRAIEAEGSSTVNVQDTQMSR